MAMHEAVFQILQLLAYVEIGLISITFPIHAICITYLKKEKWENKKEYQNRVETLKQQIANLTSKLSVEKNNFEEINEINKEIKAHKKEIKKLENKINLLSAKGAVKKPIIILLTALAVTGSGIVTYYSYLEYAHYYALGFSIVGCIFVVLAINQLYSVINATESASLRDKRHIDFSVMFKNGQHSQELILGMKSLVDIGAKPDDSIETFYKIFIPPEFKIDYHPPITILTVQPEWHRYPNYTQISTEIKMHPSNYTGCILKLTPMKSGTFEIPVEFTGKDLYKFKTCLQIIVKASTGAVLAKPLGSKSGKK